MHEYVQAKTSYPLINAPDIKKLHST
jgi:hypothetical protein